MLNRMTRRRTGYPGRPLALLTLMVLAAGSALAADDPNLTRDPRSNDLMQTFAQACLGRTLGDPDATRAWAADKHLPELTSPEGRKIYIGEGPSGAAWFFQIGTIHAVLAIRGTGACAIFGEAADPAAFQQWLDKLVSTLSAARPGTGVTTLQNDSEPGPFGNHIGKVVLLKPFPSADSAVTFTLITHERPGGAYQVTLQVATLRSGQSGTP